MAKPEEKLNTLLQGELSAVETYDMALDKVKTPSTSAVLSECRSCHVGRVAKLTEMITSMGAEPAKSSGPWGSFAKLVEAGAVALGEGSAVGAIKEGEDQGLDTYSSYKNTDDVSGQFVMANLLGPQERTKKAITELYETMPSK